MSKTFRAWKVDEPLLLPVTVQEFVPKDHLARFLLSVVEEELDLRGIMSSYTGEKGQPPFHPAMMTTLLLHAYCSGVYSSRRIAKACGERVDFMSLVGPRGGPRGGQRRGRSGRSRCRRAGSCA